MSSDERASWASAYATRARDAPRDASGGALAYGTAGFRARAERLRGVCFRAGALAGARARASGDGTTGIVITASHNPACDNGVKLVEVSGGTLPMALEASAEALANARDDDAATQIEALTRAVAHGDGGCHSGREPTSNGGGGRVFVARDTRASGRALADEALAGARAMGVEAVDRGVATTPQLHYYVYAANLGEADGEEDYYARLSSGFAALTERDEDEDEDAASPNQPPLVIDCADGVGALKLRALAEYVAPYGLEFDLRNCGDAPDASLNDGCGSDYVQKAKTPPIRGGFDALPPGTRCVSIDGDADRLIYFETRADGGIDLIDGDQLATLIADYLSGLVRDAAPFLRDIKVGVVQTAYANGASTRFLTSTLGEAPACVPTGVKHLHHAAESMDVGVYFESNGHGTALFSPSASEAIDDAMVEALTQRAMPQVKALLALKHCQRVINPAVGDAMSGILLVEAIVRNRQLHKLAGLFYEDLPSKQTKVHVADRSMIKTYDAERRCSEPSGLQDAVDAVVAAHSGVDPSVRAFVRPSGTEDCVRVYVEASDPSRVDDVTDAVVDAVRRLCA